MSGPSSITVISSALQAHPGQAYGHRVGSLRELERVLATIVVPAGRRYLDLWGHSTRHGRLLRLGETIIDMCDPAIGAFFRDLARDRLLERLNIVAVRLLGCSTAAEATGQLTMRLLAHVLRVPVYGTQKPLLRSHHDREHRFDPAFAHILISSSQLPDRWRQLLQQLS